MWRGRERVAHGFGLGFASHLTIRLVEALAKGSLEGSAPPQAISRTATGSPIMPSAISAAPRSSA